MNKIRVIDLLNKIANGEELPDKIYYDGNDYKLVEYGETTKLYQCLSEPYELININTDRLNEKVEIIEEDKKIEKMVYCEENTFKNMKVCTYLSPEEKRLLDSNFKELGNKINEIINYINKGE